MMRPHSPRAATAAQLLLFALLSGAALTPGGGAALNQAPPGPPPPQQHQQHQQLTPRRPSSQQRAGAAATGPPAGRALAQQRQDGPSSEQQAEPPRPRPPRARRRHRRKLAFDYFLHQARLEVPESEEAEGCDARVGAGYVERWRRLGGVFCAPPGGPPPPAPDARRAPPPPPLPPPPEAGSSVRCNAHPAADLTACFVSNMGFDSAAFMGPSKRPDELPAAAPGSVRLSCNLTQPLGAFLRGRLRNEGPRRWVADAARLVSPSEAAAACGAGAGGGGAGGGGGGGHAVDHAVVFFTRVDGSNAFHNAEAVVHLFLGLAALQLPQELLSGGLQVIVADDKPPGPFLDILRRLSHPHPLRMLRSDPLPPGTCLRAAAIAPWVGHGNSLLAVAAEEVGCRSVALTAAALWLRELFWDLLPSDDGAGGGAGGGGDGEEDEEGAPAPHAGERPAQRAGARTMQAVWLSRARHEAATRGRMTPWQLRRAAPNEPEVVLALQLAVMRWNNGSCPLHQAPGCHGSNVYFALQVLELGDLPFSPDQVFTLSRARVLAGVHGAGLANMLLMEPGRGAVVEVWHGMEDNYHYANLAAALGHKYLNLKSEGHLPAEDIAAAFSRAMDAAAEAHARPRRNHGRGGAGGLLRRWWGG